MKKSNYDYVQDYLDVLKRMEEQAKKVIKNYGKELDVVAEIKKLIMEENEYENEDEIMEDELEDSIFTNSYFTNYTDKHGYTYSCRIEKVRYNEKKEEIEVYLVSDEGYIDNWFPLSYVDDNVAVYSTILEFI